MKQRGAVAPATKPGWRPHRDHAGTAFRTSTRHGGYERMVGRKPRGCDAVAFPGRKAPGARFAGKTLTTASPRPHPGHTAKSGRGDRADQCRDASYDGRALQGLLARARTSRDLRLVRLEGAQHLLLLTRRHVEVFERVGKHRRDLIEVRRRELQI